MTQEQKLSRFIIGLEGQLVEEVNALWPASLVDTLIRAKAKLLNFQARDCKRMNPYPPAWLFRPQKANIPSYRIPNSEFSNPKAQKRFVQQVKVNALPVNQSSHQIQCFECCQWGHKKAKCPNKNNTKKEVWPPLPPQKEAFKSRNNNCPQEKDPAQPKNVKINYISAKNEGEEQAQIYAVLDPSGCNR